MLSDEVESRDAVEVVMRNLELLQVEIHATVIHVNEKIEMNDAMAEFMTDISTGIRNLHSKWPNLRVNLQAELVDKVEGDNLVEFNHGERLTCRYKFATQKSSIRAIEVYIMDGKHHVAVAGKGKTITFWDLSTCALVATLSRHKGDINALASYTKNGVSVLASGTSDKAIKLWDISKNINEHTFSDQLSDFTSLATYEKSGKIIPVSGSYDGEIKLIDLDNFSTIKILQYDDLCIEAFHIYYRQSKAYLRSGAYSGIKVWDLDDFKLIIKCNFMECCCLTTINYDDELTFACGGRDGRINFLSLSDFSTIEGIDVGLDDDIDYLEAIRYKGEVCLIFPRDDKMVIMNFEDGDDMAFLETDATVNKIKAFIHDGKACLLTVQERERDVKLWTE